MSYYVITRFSTLGVVVYCCKLQLMDSAVYFKNQIAGSTLVDDDNINGRNRQPVKCVAQYYNHLYMGL